VIDAGGGCGWLDAPFNSKMHLTCRVDASCMWWM
jgi:hypothetical protein